jgi:hypothetical protein
MQLENHSQSLELLNAVQNVQKHFESGKLSIDLAIKGKQLSYYKREAGEMNLALQLSAMLLSLQATYNIKNGFDEKQSVDIARAIIREYWWLKLAELYLFIEKSKNGDFGKVYDRLDRAMIFEWLSIYNEQREAHLEQKHTEQKHSHDLGASGEMVLNKLRELYPDEYKILPIQTNMREMLDDPKFKAELLRYNLKQKQEWENQNNEADANS